MKIQVDLSSGGNVWFESEEVIWRCQKNGSLRIFMAGKRVADFSSGGWCGVFEKISVQPGREEE